MEQPDRYEAVSPSTSALVGLMFGQLLQEDAISARKELERILGKVKLKLGVEQTPVSEKEE